MSIEERLAALERDNTETKRRLDELDGSFQFVVGQLRNIQTYMHTRFDAIDARFDAVDARFDRLDERLDDSFSAMSERFYQIDARLEVLPRAIAETITGDKPK